ncbi:hypothetical protein L210DRAFT_3438608 [Boletus edulis BED1]|uniref:Uncharacterized protein n=1 Tax=Boletus edulis BED1 TaxID=1328754 RepID=A0AAD4C6R8_BOLED|nr:hypothetical protein L210DRAFT_3438608 [Boletus edulis BED1]
MERPGVGLRVVDEMYGTHKGLFWSKAKTYFHERDRRGLKSKHVCQLAKTIACNMYTSTSANPSNI